MAKRILFINPVGIDSFNQPIKEYLKPRKSSGIECDVVSLDRGPQHLEYHYYEVLILPDTLNRIKQAEKEGYDAAVIGCFYDPGLREAREIVEDMIVTAPAEASMQIASTLGNKFSIIVGRNKWIPQMHENVLNYGFRDKLASFKSLGLGVHDFQKDPQETARRMMKKAREAKEEDLAEVIILGCTIEFGFFEELQKEIGVPVLDAVLASFKHAEFLLELREKCGWSHSKVGGFESPPKSEIHDWDLQKQYSMKGIWE